MLEPFKINLSNRPFCNPLFVGPKVFKLHYFHIFQLLTYVHPRIDHFEIFRNLHR